MTDLTSKTPVEIDTELARIWTDLGRSAARLNVERSVLKDLDKGVRYAGGARYTREAVEFRIEEHKAEIAKLKAEAKPFEDEYVRRGRWNRYFLVQNDNGHVHRGMDCSTCYPTTQYAWLIDLADCDEAAMIEEWGEKACTTCFPTAPTNPLYHRPARVDREAREARAAEKAAREAAKAEKAIFAPDGRPLRVPDGTYRDGRTGEIRTSYETFKTKVAARNALSGAVKDYGWYGPGHPSMFGAKIPVLIEALEAAGIETKPVIERAKKAAAKDGAPYAWEG